MYFWGLLGIGLQVFHVIII